MAVRFIETSIVRDIGGAVTYARETKRSAAIIGPPGIGKTVALERIAELDRGATYIRVSATQGTGKAAFRLLGDAFGIARGGRESADSIWNGLEDYFRYAGSWNNGEFLLVDEAQQLDLNVLKELVDFATLAPSGQGVARKGDRTDHGGRRRARQAIVALPHPAWRRTSRRSCASGRHLSH